MSCATTGVPSRVYRCLRPSNINFVPLRQNPAYAAFRRTSRGIRSHPHRVAAVHSHAHHGASSFNFPHGALTLLTGRHADLRAPRACFSRWQHAECLRHHPHDADRPCLPPALLCFMGRRSRYTRCNVQRLGGSLPTGKRSPESSSDDESSEV
jgi:hypothetical protein